MDGFDRRIPIVFGSDDCTPFDIGPTEDFCDPVSIETRQWREIVSYRPGNWSPLNLWPVLVS
jgi:hypothetical protein